MTKRLLLALVLPLLVVGFQVTESYADASVVQDSCLTYEAGGKTFLRFYFTVVNFGLPEAVCALNFLPEPQPPLAECVMVACGGPTGWACALFPPTGGADWFANAPADCIAPGTAKGQFYFDVDPGFCCYVVQFIAPDGAVMLEQEECFTICIPLPVEESTWGHIKGIYRD